MEGINNIKEEEKIAKDLSKYLHKEDFINRNLASIDRIIELYFTHYNKNPSEEKEVIAFLFKYYKENKETGPLLFRHIKNSREKYNIIKRLYNEHRYDFNFDIIPSEVYLTYVLFNEKLKRILSVLIIFIPLLIIALITSHHQVSSLKLEYKEQLNEKHLLLQKEISAKEKLESEMEILKQNYEKDLKTKEQLGTEMSTLKQNLQEEIKTIKQHFETELTTVKEKQQEANELSKCKENLQQEKLNKIQIESELITCKENFEKEQLNKNQIESELITYKENFEKEQLNKVQIESELKNCKEDLHKEKLINNETEIIRKNSQQKKNRFGFLKKNNYMLSYFVIDIIVFIIVVLFLIFTNKSITDKYFILLPFILELLMNFQFLFDTNLTFVYYGFSIIFALSIASVLIVSGNNDFRKKNFLVLPFVYTTLTSTYKYTLIIPNTEKTNYYFVISLLFIIESIVIFVNLYNLYDIDLSLAFGITMIIYSSCIDRSPFFISNVIFIIAFILLIYIVIDSSGIESFICVISLIFCLINYCAMILWKKHDKFYYISITSLLIIEIILCFFYKDDSDLCPAFLSNILLSLLALNYNLFVFLFIVVAFIGLSVLLITIFHKSKGSIAFIFLVSILQFVFSSIKAWKWYHITDFFNKLLHK